MWKIVDGDGNDEDVDEVFASIEEAQEYCDYLHTKHGIETTDAWGHKIEPWYKPVLIEQGFGDLLDEYVRLGEQIKVLQTSMNDLQREQEVIKFRLHDRMEELETSSVTDQLTKHRATKYTEKRWAIADPTEFRAAVQESPYLLASVLDTALDSRVAARIAKANPELVEEIPGLVQVEQVKLRITRGKADG